MDSAPDCEGYRFFIGTLSYEAKDYAMRRLVVLFISRRFEAVFGLEGTMLS
jgi:hypothetical protein